MKTSILILAAALAVTNLSCTAHPQAGLAGAKVSIVASPHAGLEQGFTHVAVYDAAPKPPAPTGQFEHVDYSHLTDIIVWLQPVDKVAAPAVAPCVVVIDSSKPSSDVHAASVGQKIILRNVSSSAATFYSVSDGNDFSLSSIAPGASGEYTPRAEGLIEILVDPAKPPVALIYAAPSEWVVRARSGQSVTFNNLPPGRYQAVSWHPRLPGAQTDLTLSAGEVSHCALSVGVNNLSKSPG